MSLSYIRKSYGVPAKRGGKIKFTDCDGSVFYGRIKSAKGGCLRILVEEGIMAYRIILVLHPTWNVEYLESK